MAPVSAKKRSKFENRAKIVNETNNLVHAIFHYFGMARAPRKTDITYDDICVGIPNGNPKVAIDFLISRNCISADPPQCPKCGLTVSQLSYFKTDRPPIWRCRKRDKASNKNCDGHISIMKDTIFFRQI